MLFEVYIMYCLFKKLFAKPKKKKINMHRSEAQGRYWCSIAFELLYSFDDPEKKANLAQQVILCIKP